MILSDRDLRCYLRRGDLVVAPLTDVQIQPCSIDLRLSPEIQRYRPAFGDLLDAREKQVKNLVDEEIGERLILWPGDCVLARTIEEVKIPPTLVGKVEGRSTLGRLFVAIHITAGWIDPGFRGTIVLEISNQNRYPVVLYPGDRVCQLVLYQLSSAALRPYGHKDIGSKYQDQAAVVGARADQEVGVDT